MKLHPLIRGCGKRKGTVMQQKQNSKIAASFHKNLHATEVPEVHHYFCLVLMAHFAQAKVISSTITGTSRDSASDSFRDTPSSSKSR